MTVAPVRVSPEWLALREPADAAARSSALAGRLRMRLRADETAVIHDLGCGTGAMARWLAPLLPGRQHWVLHDHDPDLLAQAALTGPTLARDGDRVSLETREGDVSRLRPGELGGASLVTASALLDLVTGQELARLVAACSDAGCPVLVTLSVVGRVEISPHDPLDALVAEAFNAHQRRTTEGGTLLGPGAVGRAAEAFLRSGADVLVAPSPWRLGAADASLAVRWLEGWVEAAGEQRPGLRPLVEEYTRRRVAAAWAGRLSVTVHHRDLLVVPR